MPDKKPTDNEIVKALNTALGMEHISIYCANIKNEVQTIRVLDIIDLINRQKAELEKFKKRQKPTGASGYKIENGKVVFFTNMLGGCKIVKENLEEVVKTLNELLHEAYSKDEIVFALKCKTEELKTAKAEAYKEFAEEAKKRTGMDYLIDELLKELVEQAVKERKKQ